MQFKLKEEELAALISPGRSQGYDPIQQLILSKLFKDDDKKKDDDKPKGTSIFGYKVIREKKESTASLAMWVILALMAFSSPVSIFQDWLTHSLRAALQ